MLPSIFDLEATFYKLQREKFSIMTSMLVIICRQSHLAQGHWEFSFGNSREFAVRKIPAGIPGNFYELTFLH